MSESGKKRDVPGRILHRAEGLPHTEVAIAQQVFVRELGSVVPPKYQTPFRCSTARAEELDGVTICRIRHWLTHLARDDRAKVW